MPLSKLITDFLEYLEKERNASQLTIRNYDHYLRRFADFAQDVSLKDINIDLIKKYRLYLSDWKDPQNQKPLKKITQNYFMIALRAFLKYLAEKDIPVLSYEKVELGDAEQGPMKVLDESEIRTLLMAPDTTEKSGLRDKAILETLFSTGLRVSELAALSKETINLQERDFRVLSKGGKERMVFLSDAAAQWLGKYLNARNDTFKPLFIRFQGKVDPSNDGEAMRLTPRSIERIVEKYVKKTGLSVKATPHTLRHGFAKDQLTNGADIHLLQEMLGHAHISTTQAYRKAASSAYTHITNKHFKDVSKTFHSGNK